MLKKLVFTLIMAVGAAVVARAFNVFDGGLPASAPPPLSGETEWASLQPTFAPASSDSRQSVAGLQTLKEICFGRDPKSDHCERLAALSADEATGARALRVAAGVRRGMAADRADELLLLAATSSARALAEYGRHTASDEADQHVRVQALVEAARAGNAQAATWIVQGYEMTSSEEAISQPLWTALLLHGHAYAIPDTVGSREWLYSLGTGVEATCPFQSVLFNTASFKRSKQRFAAGMTAHSQEQLARSTSAGVVRFARSLRQFGQDLSGGRGYQVAAEGLFNRLRHAHHELNHVAALGTEAGARDAVRVVELVGGCQTAHGVRTVTDLGNLYGARAGRPMAVLQGGAQ